MSEPLYERYKEALRRGHVAAVRGRSAEALEAYGEAAGIAPDRALPLVGMAGVLARVGKPNDALTAYDAALERSPDDQGALRGRAEVLQSTGDRAGAAATLDRLAVALDAAGELPQAAEAARQALELAENRGRRDALHGYVDRLREATDDQAAADELARGSQVLEPIVIGPPPGSEADVMDAEPVVPFDPGTAMIGVEAALAADDVTLARDLALAAASGYRAAGQRSAAIDVCYMTLAASPDDPGLHLALAELYLDHGWRALATDKLALLGQLAGLTDDTATRDKVCAIARAQALDAPKLAAICA